MIRSIFPFLKWFDYFRFQTLRIDLISGLTVALVLIPQSMAYAQLAGLPAYYGLYAAFLPPIIAALFGSSNQLATGPVAIVSLMTATALAPLATAGGENFICYAIMLSLMVGLFQLSLGVLRLGLVVNFLSHPVVNGFTNAAAIIIATSQLSKIFGVQVDSYEHHYETVYRVIEAAIKSTHWPTFAFALSAFGIMYFLKRIDRRIPNVLAAVIVTTLISYFTGFENNRIISLDKIKSQDITSLIEQFNSEIKEIEELGLQLTDIAEEIQQAKKQYGSESEELLRLKTQASMINIRKTERKKKILFLKNRLRDFSLAEVITQNSDTIFQATNSVSTEAQLLSKGWDLKVGNIALNPAKLTLIGGGVVVGVIPRGLPEIKIPKVNFQVALNLISMAVIISILGFMEAISIAKAMAVKTGQRLDPNQELIGQGLANIAGAFSQSYPVSGSFSRSAVNLQAGAITGLSNAFSSLVVLITLLFLTPLLYHLPQSVLAAIIMMAVIGLVNVKGFIHAYQAQKYDGIIAVVSFAGTLAFAPHLDKGIMIGILLSLGHFLYRNIKPETAFLSKYVDGTFRSAKRRHLKTCRHIAVLRFNNSLFFANVSYLEDRILEIISTMGEIRQVHIVFNAINELDASGEASLSTMITRLREKNIDFSLSGVNESVLDVMNRTHLIDRIGEDNIYGNVANAVKSIHKKTHRNTREEKCPLLEVVPEDEDKFMKALQQFKGKDWIEAVKEIKVEN
ncbi:SulP family inorganic anion transporter [bacterium]|nr:SulP family inorganic anion transporter [bacterium]